jgi:uncharacterized protein YndB with AHSA1/START domain
MNGELDEVIAPEKIVFTSAALDKDNQRRFEVFNTVTLIDETDKTKLTLQVKVSNIKPGAEQHVKGMNEGWSQTIERLINLIE